MRRIVTLLAHFALLQCFEFSALSAIVVQWDFNSASPDADTSTGAAAASRGTGTLNFLGGTASSFGTVAGGSISDPAEADDSQMRITRLPPQGSNNKGAGLEIELSTRGYENLTLSWDHYNSATASRYWRVLFTTDWLQWTDDQVLTQTTASVWVRHTVDLREISAANDSATVGLRIVPEFESTATGAGADEYIAVRDGSNYGTSGTWWIDVVTVSGNALGVSNTPPVVSAMADIVLDEGSSSDPVEITVSDAETAAEELMVTTAVSSSEIITNLVLTGSGPNRQLVLHAGSPGEALVTIRVTDQEGDSAETSFNVVVLPRGEEQPILKPFVYWSFNSRDADADATTGAWEPAAGMGELRIVGANASTFGTVGQGRTSDPAETDNSMLRITGFPRQGTSNHTAGLEFRASTVGFGNITLVWDHYNSATASRYWIVQYTTNGSDFIGHFIFTNSTASTWLRQRSVTFENLPGVENNPQFGVRIVSSFGEAEGYEAVSSGSNYGTTGTLWLDMVGLTGEIIADEAPRISCALSSEGLLISWSKRAESYALEVQDGIGLEWQPLALVVEETENEFQFTVPLEGHLRFFRLLRNSSNGKNGGL